MKRRYKILPLLPAASYTFSFLKYGPEAFYSVLEEDGFKILRLLPKPNIQNPCSVYDRKYKFVWHEYAGKCICSIDGNRDIQYFKEQMYRYNIKQLTIDEEKVLKGIISTNISNKIKQELKKIYADSVCDRMQRLSNLHGKYLSEYWQHFN